MCIRGQPERPGPVPMMKKILLVRRLPRLDSHSMAFFSVAVMDPLYSGQAMDDGVGVTNGVSEGFGFVRYALSFNVRVEHWDGVEVVDGGVRAFSGGNLKHVLE